MSLLILLSVGSHGLAQDWKSGEDRPVSVPSLASPVAVHTPVNYSPDQHWPILFHYHTNGMGPNVQLPAYYSNESDFILVAMIREESDIFLQEEPFWRNEFAKLVEVRSELVKQGLQVDVNRTYLGGLGLGGWYASYLADFAMAELAGVYVMAAGTYTASKLTPKPVRKRMPIYVGVAQLETNYAFALNATEHFRRLGAQVTFDEYLGLNHVIPMPPGGPVAERFRQWLQIEANLKTPEEGRRLVAAWSEKIDARLATLEAPMDQFLLIEHVATFPFYAALPAATRAKLKTRREELMVNPKLRDEMLARREFAKLNHEETLDFAIRNRRRIASNYASLYQKFPETHYGARAGLAMIRLRDPVENPDRWMFQSEEQKERFLEEVKRRPLPSLPQGKLMLEMERVTEVLSL
tara:strand:+ start:47246 stop:48472 length:1227 start_codon:yes stop_codon:yes gene_type:complete